MSTNFATGIPGTVVEPYFTNSSGDIIFARCTVANIPTGAGYAVGCMIQASDTGNGYVNTGTTSAASFTLLDAGTAFSLPIAATDSTTTTGTSVAFTQNAITSGNGLTQSLNGLTVGTGQKLTHTTSVIASGGSLMRLSSTGIDTSTTTGVLLDLSSTASLAGTQVLGTFSGLTTGIGMSLVAAATTTGVLNKATAAAATLTTGRYYSANDGALEVFGIGANGHIHGTQTTAPSIAVTQQNGITAAAITAGSSDTAGIITTTGTNNNGGTSILQITFNKTYTAAPKAVVLYPANAAGAKASGTGSTVIGNGTFVSAIAATTFDVTMPADLTALATPSFRYIVIA